MCEQKCLRNGCVIISVPTSLILCKGKVYRAKKEELSLIMEFWSFFKTAGRQWINGLIQNATVIATIPVEV